MGNSKILKYLGAKNFFFQNFEIFSKSKILFQNFSESKIFSKSKIFQNEKKISIFFITPKLALAFVDSFVCSGPPASRRGTADDPNMVSNTSVPTNFREILVGEEISNFPPQMAPLASTAASPTISTEPADHARATCVVHLTALRRAGGWSPSIHDLV